MANLFNRDANGRVSSLMSKYEEVKAFYSYAGIYENSGYQDTKPLYVSIFSYIDDGNEEKATKTRGLSARQYYIYNQGLSLGDVNIPKDKRKKVKSASEFKGLLDKQVNNYIKQVAGKYATMSERTAYKIVEQRFKENMKELGISPIDPDEEFNDKFLEAVFKNSKKLTKNASRDLIAKTFEEIQIYINKRLDDKSASLKKSGTNNATKKDFYILEFDKKLKGLNEEFDTLLTRLRQAMSEGFKEGFINKSIFTQLNIFLNNLENKALIYEKKVTNKTNLRKGYVQYFNEDGIRMAMKSLISEKDNKKLSMMNEISSILNNAAGLGYEIAILAAAIELFAQGRSKIGDFKDISREELERRSLQILVSESKGSKNIKIDGRTFSGQVTGDLIVDGKMSKADVVLRIENELKKSKREFKISAKKHNKQTFKVHTGKFTSFSDAIRLKGRGKEGEIAQSMFDTISWYPSHFKRGKGNDGIFNILRKMLILNMDYFYGFDVTQLFSTKEKNYENIVDAITRTQIKNIKINKNNIELMVKVNKGG